MKTYVRPMAGWWRRNPYYLWYMARELSSVLITIYALVLLAGLARLAQGRQAYEGWLQALEQPVSLAFHALALVLVLYHAWTWFKVMPRTMPNTRIPDALIVGGALAASVLLSAGLLAVVWWFSLWSPP